jgi:signal transduction histidine kinase
MNAIMGMASFLADTPLTSEQSDCVSIIADNSKSLLALLNTLLDFSKLEFSNLELETRKINLHKTIHKAVHLLAKNIGSEKVALKVQPFEHSLPQFVIGDKLRLSQVLINLISNAAKFTKEGRIYHLTVITW